MSDEHDNGSMRDEGDDGIPEPDFVAGQLARMRVNLYRTIDCITLLEQLVRTYGFDGPALTGLLDAVELFDDDQNIFNGIAKALQRIVNVRKPRSVK